MTKKNKLGLAVAAALSIGAMTQSVQAANIAANGIGEVAYVPYYTAGPGKTTYVRLTNNSFDTIAVKLKFREGVESQDMLDFHLFLSPRDVWVGQIGTVDGQVVVTTADTSCTVPSKGAGFGLWAHNGGTSYSAAVPNLLSGAAPTEGYIVAQVMGASDGRLPTQGSLFDAVSYMQHNGQPAPSSCDGVSGAFELVEGSPDQFRDLPGLQSLKSQFTSATNSLSVAAAFVNASNATLVDMPVTVIANAMGARRLLGDGYADDLARGVDIVSNDTIGNAGDDKPDARDAKPAVATIFDDGSALAGSYLAGAYGTDAISLALMKSSVSNYIDVTGSNSWVVTFPTKKFHKAGPNCAAPFPAGCEPTITAIQHSVHPAGVASYVTNEEESEASTPPTGHQICFSGPRFAECQAAQVINPGAVSLPHEVNVVAMGSGNALASALVTTIDVDKLGGLVGSGWMQMRFTNAPALQGAAGDPALYGLPVIGFGYTEYPLAGLTGVMTQEHVYTSPLMQ